MFTDAWFLGSKDLKYMLRQRETILWTFLLPIVFFFFIGSVTGGMQRRTSGPTTVLVEREGDPGWLYQHLLRRLADQDIRVVEADTVSAPERYRRRLQVPATLTGDALAGRQVTLTLKRQGGGLGADYDEIRFRRAVYTVVADLAASVDSAGARPDLAGLTALADLPRRVTLEVREAGSRRDIPTGFEQSVPGTMVMFTLLIMLTSGAILLVIEREEGLMRRLASTPIRRGSVVLGKWGARMALGIVQIGFAMLAGTLLFRVGWGPDLPMLGLVMLTYGAVCASLGLLLGNLARTRGQAVAIGVLASNVLAALGGCWWPIEVTPAWMQQFALFLPTGWAMDALHKLVSFQAGAASAAPHAAGMALAAVLLGAGAARIFRFR